MKAANLLRWGTMVLGVTALAADRPPSPDVLFGPLFFDVQRAGIFPDQKTFVDCVPKEEPAKILAAYAEAKRAQSSTSQPFDLKAFVSAHFLIPEVHGLASLPENQSVEQHVTTLWARLKRTPEEQVRGGSLLPLPGPYIVPGGRFREVYYWDSYFTFLGLRESGEEALIESMVDNFAYLIEQYGYIPNGNRSYFLSRSQPPFFALMVEFLAEKKGDEIYVKYLPALRAELDYWMDRTAPTHHVVTMPNGGTLNRYYDQLDTPRPEAFAREEAVSHRSTQEPTTLYRNLRAACESGWDFSSRWFADGRTIETIQTTDIVPVDLNCLLYQLETTLAKAYSVSGDKARAGELAGAAQSRRDAIVKSFWADGAGYFCDFNLKARGTSEALTLAGVTPLFFHLATPEQAEGVMRKIKEKFLKPGGVVTTLVTTGQQWDAPNGWAPLQWLTIRGLENYGYHELAAEIAHRWLRLNTDVYNRTGKMMEKYNVVDTTLTAGGGEYPSQDGFGWTNGVFLKLLHTYPENK